MGDGRCRGEASVVGLIRFSLITRNAETAWEIARNTDRGTYRNIILSPERLEKRFSLFEAFVLPSLDSQTNLNFQAVIMASSHLPNEFRKRIEGLCENRAYLKLRYFDDVETISSCASKSIKGLGLDTGRVVTFRLDDDDALAKNYISLLHTAAIDLKNSSVISASKGIYVRANDIKTLEIANVTIKRNAQGLSYLAIPPIEDTIFHVGSHSRVSASNMFDVSPVDAGWVRAVHNDSDSAIVRDVFRLHDRDRSAKKYSVEQAKAYFEANFPLLNPRAMIDSLIG